MNEKEGMQVIILWDAEKLTDFYQNICGEHLLKEIEFSARDYAESTNGALIHFKT